MTRFRSTIGKHECVEVAGEQLELFADRAVFWPRKQTLFVADLHLGKTATFRAAAIPLPGGTTANALGRLDRIIAASQARRFVVLGDLLHARSSKTRRTLAELSAWRARHPQLEVLLVRGNHDRHSGDPPIECGFVCVDEPFEMKPFSLRHFPDACDKGYVLAGHIHPAVRLSGFGGRSESVACFWFASDIAVLPAFGEFTGTKRILPSVGDQVFAVADDEVVRLA